MKITTQIPLIYFASRLYPNLSFNQLKRQNVQLLSGMQCHTLRAGGRIKLSGELIPLNEAIEAALNLEGASTYFESLRKPPVIRNLNEQLEEATALEELEDIFPGYLINQRLGEIARSENGELQIDEDGDFLVGEDGYFKSLDLISGLMQDPLGYDKEFSYARFYKEFKYNPLTEGKTYKTLEVLELLTLALDLGIIEVVSTEPVKFKVMLSEKACQNIRELFEKSCEQVGDISWMLKM